ncbi:hypothetical protein ZYGR_0AD03150 [Zygosaccharomyces rouxii]|uniref:ZYRO0G13310p n=2 Tax=Zygosaccharomyces rouxii TaxID=4956 RepID=C5E0J7_ZYGRC|nr:uncharacterized protein ZYRO0G13310g [Zygosaccharomyces rouxii]KAH9202625.1 hypothetical protein LQ764DRAFT_35861 [Zygosaccharomyces rouxii]GAV51132.1 hypothetical protein ZYGR_0AD03150 [Zygosaccharomyces rouxii]CAR29631.1 ZYRO0G13310p [Zygosaccharomyces rouxii]
MVLESKWADAPDEPEPVKPKNTKKQPTSLPHNNAKKDKKKKYRHDKGNKSPERPRSQPETIHAQPKNDHPRPHTHPQTRLVFSTKDTDLKDVKVEKVERESREESPKLDLLKQRIEEQRRILEQKKHKKQQEELLQSFLHSDDKLDWDEDEEDQILEKLNKSLKV